MQQVPKLSAGQKCSVLIGSVLNTSYDYCATAGPTFWVSVASAECCSARTISHLKSRKKGSRNMPPLQIGEKQIKPFGWEYSGNLWANPETGLAHTNLQPEQNIPLFQEYNYLMMSVQETKFNLPCLKRHPGSSGNLNYFKIATSHCLVIQYYLLEKALDMLVANAQVKQLHYTVPIECFCQGAQAQGKRKHEYEFVFQFGALECFCSNSVLIKPKH